MKPEFISDFYVRSLGLLLSLLAVFIILQAIRKLSGRDLVRNNAEKIVFLKIDEDSTVERIQQLLKRLSYQDVHLSSDKLTISAKNRMSFTSWGEAIFLNFLKSETSAPCVKISSRSVMRTTITDGKKISIT